MPEAQTKVPIVLVTGFLGSGKTTLLRRLAKSHPDWRIVFLVNEYAETSVDGDTLTATGSPTHSVVGGSLFCECKAGDFLRTMREDVLGHHRKKPIDAVVIETSGTADPEAIGRLMSDHGLADNFELRSIITVVAPSIITKLLGNLPVVEAQLQSSDTIVINKTDTVDENEMQAVESAMREQNPTARLLRASYCDIDFLLRDKRPQAPDGDLSTCDANPFSTLETTWPAEASLARAEAWLQTLPPTILRIKGRIQTPAGFHHIERTVDGLSIQAAEPGPSRLVLIAHDDHEDDLEAAAADVAGLSA